MADQEREAFRTSTVHRNSTDIYIAPKLQQRPHAAVCGRSGGRDRGAAAAAETAAAAAAAAEVCGSVAAGRHFERFRMFPDVVGRFGRFRLLSNVFKRF